MLMNGVWQALGGDSQWMGPCLAGLGLLLPVLAYGIWPKLTQAILGDLRVPRILYFWVLTALGASVYGNWESPHLPITHWLTLIWPFIIWLLALTYAAIFAIVTNNLADQTADRIANPNRPLVAGIVAPKPYLIAGIVCLGVSLFLAWLYAYPMGWGILAISLGYFVYSVPPIRLKRIPILSKAIIGFNSWAVVLTGYVLGGGNFQYFPWQWSLFIWVPLSVAANFIDLKDVEGDRAAGIATLPVWLGVTKARWVIALGTIATYAWAGLLLHVWFVYPLGIVWLGVHLYFLFRKPYSDAWVFITLLIALTGLVIFLFFK